MAVGITLLLSARMQEVGLDTAELSAASRPVAPPKAPRDRSKKRQTELIIHEATRKSSRRDKTDTNKTDEEIRQDQLVRNQPRRPSLLRHPPDR